MKVDEIHRELERMDGEGKKLFVTSSFQTHSIPLLHIISRSAVNIPVYCLNTGFLFPETLAFRDRVADELGLALKTVRSSTPKHQQRNANGNFFFTSNPDYCCHLNKVEPTERLLRQYDVWVNGVRADQNLNRRQLSTYQDAKFDSIRFHPMLDWSGKDIYAYIKEYNLPKNPLDAEGYQSIGCIPCTRKADLSDPRAARWYGLNKTECGLHTELTKK
jgi:phosphoadenosine phosphosulfate reductase